MSKKFVIATNNAHKVEEFKKILAPLGISCYSLKEMGLSCEAEETGTTFAENARIKAKAVYDLCHLPTVADDSGICVDALGGAPGVYSARFGAEGLDDPGRTALLLEKMEQEENRAAHFTSAICCILGDGIEIVAEGAVYGSLLRAPRGKNGFGYDPIFLPEGYAVSTAEMDSESKNAISHRGIALRKLADQLKEYENAEQ